MTVCWLCVGLKTRSDRPSAEFEIIVSAFSPVIGNNWNRTHRSSVALFLQFYSPVFGYHLFERSVSV